MTNGYITNYQYYLNGGTAPLSINHGSGQHISITDIINNYMLVFVGDDKMVDNVAKHIVRFHAKQAVKGLNYDSIRSFQALEFVIGTDLNLVMPPDYVNYVRLSQEVNGVLYPLTENRATMSASAYLEDNTGELLFAANGEVLVGTSELDATRVAGTATGTDVEYPGCKYYSVGSMYGSDPSKMNANPKFEINMRAGVINFDSTMSGKTVVLEYISDGMENGDDANIVVHKFFEKYLYSYLTYEILDSKYGVSAVKILEAKKKRAAELANSRIRISGINPEKLLMLIRGQNKWIK